LVLALTFAQPVLADDLNVAASRRYDMAPNASGFFIDLDGSVLTARHVVDGCQSLYTLKDGRVARADLIATSDAVDLAVIRSSIKPYLAASFATADQVKRSQPIFAAGYDELRHLKNRTTLMYNGFALDPQSRPGEAQFAMYSGADHGASGSPVLDGNGLVIGLIAKREIAGGQTVVIAVSGTAIKTFLHHVGVAFHDSDQPQLSPLQAHAPRAATLMVGIICG
jgi:S1-C subfamily serine protease